MEELDIPKVVRIRQKDGKVVQDCTYYIGRSMTMGGWKLKESIFANPFTVKEHGEKALPLFREYLKRKIADDPEKWVIAIMDLKGHTLGCWCKEKPSDFCHGDVLVEFYVKLKEIFTMEDREEAEKLFRKFLE